VEIAYVGALPPIVWIAPVAAGLGYLAWYLWDQNQRAGRRAELVNPWAPGGQPGPRTPAADLLARQESRETAASGAPLSNCVRTSDGRIYCRSGDIVSIGYIDPGQYGGGGGYGPPQQYGPPPQQYGPPQQQYAPAPGASPPLPTPQEFAQVALAGLRSGHHNAERVLDQAKWYGQHWGKVQVLSLLGMDPIVRQNPRVYAALEGEIRSRINDALATFRNMG
jgi:hypothetical protein